MKRTASFLVVVIAASAAWAQTTGAGNPAAVMGNARNAVSQVNKASSGQTGATARPATGTPATPATNRPTSEALGDAARKVAAPIKGTAVPPSKKPTAKKAAAPASAPAPAATAGATAAPNAAAATAMRKRDPFVSPIVSRVGGPSGCTGGKKCLVVDQVALKGVVRAPNGMIAVIVNPANKAYFMRENDPVYNGFVVKITSDSIVFQETVTDRVGKSSTREVVKKVNAPAV